MRAWSGKHDGNQKGEHGLVPTHMGSDKWGGGMLEYWNIGSQNLKRPICLNAAISASSNNIELDSAFNPIIPKFHYSRDPNTLPDALFGAAGSPINRD
jgi:hypothetical protein